MGSMRRARFAKCGPVRGPEGAFVIRWGGSATAGRRPCSGSEREAQRTPGHPRPAGAIVIFGRISSIAARWRVLLRDHERSRRLADAILKSANRRGCDPVNAKAPFLRREKPPEAAKPS